MKTVVLIRHAKTEEWNIDKDDFNRQLTSRGVSDSELIAGVLKDENILPDHVITSPAVRSLETAELFCEFLNYPIENISKAQSLYDGLSTQDFLNLLSGLKKNIETVFVFGHNPVIHYFAANFAHQSVTEMPTCSSVVIQFDVDSWDQLAVREGNLIHQFIPRFYK